MNALEGIRGIGGLAGQLSSLQRASDYPTPNGPNLIDRVKTLEIQIQELGKSISNELGSLSQRLNELERLVRG